MVCINRNTGTDILVSNPRVASDHVSLGPYLVVHQLSCVCNEKPSSSATDPGFSQAMAQRPDTIFSIILSVNYELDQNGEMK